MNAATAEAPAPPPAAKRRRRPSGVAVGVALIVAIVVLKVFVAEPFRIPSESMEPTLQPGDQALVYKLAGKPPHRGDLVVFHAPKTG